MRDAWGILQLVMKNLLIGKQSTIVNSGVKTMNPKTTIKPREGMVVVIRVEERGWMPSKDMRCDFQRNTHIEGIPGFSIVVLTYGNIGEVPTMEFFVQYLCATHLPETESYHLSHNITGTIDSLLNYNLPLGKPLGNRLYQQDILNAQHDTAVQKIVEYIKKDRNLDALIQPDFPI
jgi:hypothetical protein